MSFLNAIKAFWLKRSLKKNLPQAKSLNYQKSSDFCIMLEVSSETDFKSLQTFIRPLQQDGKTLSLILFLSERIPEDAIPTFEKCTVYPLKEADFWWKAFLKKRRHALLEAVFQQEFDFSIKIMPQLSFWGLTYLFSKISSSIKIGVHNEAEQGVYDVMVAAQKDMKLSDYLQFVAKLLAEDKINKRL